MRNSVKGLKPLVINAKKKYFLQVKKNLKKEEYRKISDFWDSRLIGKKYSCIAYCSGYPKLSDPKRVQWFEWEGWETKPIRHEEFGNKAFVVYAIKLNKRIEDGKKHRL